MKLKSLRFFALLAILFVWVSSALAGTAYSDGRAYLRQGSPTNAGKVYVSTNGSTPAASAYKVCNTVQTSETTTPSASAQVKGEKTKTTYHFWAQANAGYKFIGWYSSTGALQGSGAEHISASVTSGTAGSSDTHAYLDMHAAFIKIIQMSFIVPTNGSFEISHNGDAVSNYASITVDGKVVLTAHPNDGYKLKGWYTTTNGGATKSYFAFGNTCEPNFTSNVTIGADFTPDDGKATFYNASSKKIYSDLNTANNEASSGHVLVVVSDGILGAGTYTIKSGVTLLIPHNESFKLMTTPEVKHYTSAGAAPKLSAFRRFALASDAIINCSGNICIGGQQTAVNGGNPTSLVCGPVGVLDLSQGGTINMKSGSKLYAWGFVKGQDMEQGNNTAASGVGEINAASGATIFEDFQCGEWRGGTASSTIYSNKGSWKFFPFQSYTIQNIEAPVNYAQGSSLQCHWAIFGNGSTFTVSFPLIAASNSLFLLGSSGTIRKWYDPTTDRVCYELGGSTSLNALKLNVLGENISSEDYNLPIPANMHIILKSGNTLSIGKPMTAHAGAVVEVKSGAKLNINAKVYMYDADDWDTYCMYAYYYRTYNNLTSHYNRGTGTSKANLEDATLIVDGTVTVGAQMLYATAHGARIIGNGGGTFQYGTLPSNTTMTQCKTLSDAVTVNIRSANLCNDNNTYTKGIAGTKFYNVNGRWFVYGKQSGNADKTFTFTYIKSGDVYGTAGTDATVTSCYSKDKTGIELRQKWANVKADVCDNWWAGLEDTYLYNYTLNNDWHQYIKTGSTAAGEGESPIEDYAGSDGKLYKRQDCDITEAGSIDANCLYTVSGVKKALVNGAFVDVAKNTADEAYHKVGATTTYYICFDGCVWHPATKVSGKEKAYTVDGKVYIWYDGEWLGVENDATVSLYYSLSSTNVKIYYDYISGAWDLAVPVAEVVTSSGAEQVFAITKAFEKAAAGGTNVTVRLLKDISISTAISYTTANNCGLDLNGHTLTGTVTNMITINNASCTFIVKDQSGAGTGKIKLSVSENARRSGVHVTKGHLILNSGTIYAENTMAYNSTSAKATQICAILVKAGQKFTMNGGTVTAEATYNPYGIYSDGANSIITINGGTINCTSTSKSSPYAIISYGTININGGTINATAETTTAVGIYVNADTSKQGTLNMAGGTINAVSEGGNTAHGIIVNRGLSYQSTTAEPRLIKQEFPAIAHISGGTVNVSTTKASSTTAMGISTYGTTEVSGGEFVIRPKASTGIGVRIYGGTTTISGNAHFDVQATESAYGVRISEEAPNEKGGPLYNGTLEMNGGKLDVKTTTGIQAYGVYVGAASKNVTTTHASDASYFAGNYANAGTATINDGEINATAKTTDAYAVFVEAALSGTFTGNKTPKLTINGGKFKVASTNGSTSNILINNTAATAANFSMAGGYYSKAPNGTTNIAAGKTVQDLDATVEASLISAGYTKKIAGVEYTVTWKNFTGSTILKTEKVESGKVPVWTGERPDYKDATSDREWIGWATDTWNRGTKYVNGTPLPAIVDADVTYYAACQAIYADVTAGGTTTRYNSAQTAWTEAMKHKQATIRILSNLGSEANVGNMTELVFNPANEGSIITLDLNGHIWTMGNHTTASYNKNVFLKVSPSKANCKLIVTDNSASGNGYLMNKWACGGNLICAQVTAGELVLQGGAIKCNNTSATNNAVGVQTEGTGVFTMLGGTIDSKKDGDDVTGGTASGVYCYSTTSLAGGTIKATNTKLQAIGVYVMRRNVSTVLEDGLNVEVNAKSGAYVVHGYGAADIQGGTYTATATSGNARGIYLIKSSDNLGTATVTGNPTFTVSSPSGNYGVMIDGGDSNEVNATINGGTFTVTASAGHTAVGVAAMNKGVVTVKDGTFSTNVSNADYEQSFGAYALNKGTVNVEGGTFNVTSAKVGGNNDGARCYVYDETTLNISGGTFTVTNGNNAVRSFGGVTTITGNPKFTARYGVDAGSWAAAADTAKVTIDGGTFICTAGYALRSMTHTHATNGTVTGDLTVWDGRFYSEGTYPISYDASYIPYTKIRGGYYSYYSSSNASLRLEPFVVSPSTTEAYATTIDGKAYTYRVNTKYNVTWKNGTTTLSTEQYNRNEVPKYGTTGEYVPNDGNTYEFIGWTPEIAPVTADATYTANYKKYEAMIILPGQTTGKVYEHFTDAWTDALQIQNCTIRVLSNVYYGASLTYNPAPPAGTTAEDEAYFTNATTTLDLNNHIVNYTAATATYALTINKTGSKLIIDDSSTQKGGQFGHRQDASKVEIRGIYVQNGELQLAGGTIIAKNTCIDGESGAGAYAIVGGGVNSIFNMTGGTLLAQSRLGARAYNSSGDGVFNATGGDIIATTEYTESSTTKWGANAYGVVLWNYGTFNMSGTTNISVTSGSSAIGVYPYGGDKKGYPIANISGGSISCLTKTDGTARSVNVHGARATVNISGGDITANGPAGKYNIEDVSVHYDAVANITGGNFHSTTGANCVGVRVFGGTATISSNAFFDSQRGVVVGDWAEAATATATAYINGGTFDCPVFAVLSKSNTNKYDGTNDGTVTGTTYVNGGYFKTASGQKICSTSSETGRLILNGGYYNETSGTTQKSNITTYKGSTTQVNTLSPAITVDGRTYHYELKTKFNVTWKGGSSYNKVEELWSGTMPSNAECTSFVRNDSTFYFTGWTPTPSPVISDITYNAEGEYHVAKVRIGSGAWKIYDDFDEAWNDAMAATNANVNITLLNNVTLDDYLAYKPTIANARTTLDLNNFTLTQNSALYSIHVNKADAKLTITDTSADRGGCIYKKMSSSTSIYGVYVYNGEAIMAGGKIYCENTIDNTSWHPAGGLYNASANAKITVTGGTVEAAAQITAYAITGYGPVNVSGGLVKATVKKYNNARALSQQMNTATITGGTFEAYSTGNATGIYAVMAGAWIGSTAASAQSATVNISGGKFKAQTASSSAVCAFADGVVKKIGEEIVTAHGTLTITGGEFTTLAPAATATQIFSVVSSGGRLFDDDHNLIGESKGEANISGGTFLVDTRNDGAYVVNKNNNDILRCWGTINITGGTFTIYQNSGATGIGCYRGKVTISGNPVFNINGTTQTRGIIAGPWNHSSYCDKDATNNLAEIEVNGGTFNVTATGTDGNVIGAWTNGSISATSATDANALAGYAMSSKITINGGEFICTGQKAVRSFYQYGPVTGTYGTAKREIFVNGGKFKSQIATFNADGTINTVTGAGANVETGNASVKLAGLTGGYYSNNNHLEANRADTCKITTLTNTDPEYANGYRYKIEPDYVAKVTVGSKVTKYTSLSAAFDYAKTQNNATITLLRTVDDYAGPTLYYNPTTAKSCTLDLNGFTFKGQATSGEPDRLLIVSNAGSTFTIKDSSAGKTGKFSHEKSGANFSVVVYHGTLVLESGTVHCKNTSGSAQALRSTDPDAIIQVTGGKAHAEATTYAYGVNSYGPATISGGEILAEGTESAYGVNSQDANADVQIKGTAKVKAKIQTANKTCYGVNAAGGGKITITGSANIETESVHGCRAVQANANSTITISENAIINANSDNHAYGIYAEGTSAKITVEAGTINSENANANGSSITAYANSSGNIEINGGTFTSKRSVSGTSNVQPIRTGNNATMIINDGTFNGSIYQAVNIRGGETTINGGTFTAATGIRAMDWADAATIKGKLTVKGGTFNTTAQTIYVSSMANNSRNAHSEVTIEGGKFKSTGSTIVQMDAAPAGADPSTLTITGGFFNEKAGGTTFKTQIANFVSDPYEVFTLEDGDANKTAGYAYEVCEKRVAKVKTGSTTTYYTTIRAALAYAKTKANPTITLLDNCTLSPEGDANYNKLTTASWTGTLDLNNFTLTPTIDGNGRALTVGGSGSKLTITDNSVSKGGQIYYQGSHPGQFIYIVVEDGAEVEFAGGTLYVDNTSASGVMVGFVINGTTAKFKQTAGTFTLKSKDQAKVFYGTGKAEFTGGTINVEAETQAIGLNPNTASTVLNISGTFKLNVKAVNAYGVYASAGTTTIEGTPDFYVEGSTRARVLQGTNTGNLTVNSGTFEAKITSGVESDSYVLIPEGSSTLTVNGGKFSSNKNHIAYKSSTGTLAIKGGYFNESTGTYHKSEIETYCVAPKHCVPMTAAEIATVGSDYKYKVVDAYTLTWDVNGGNALTGTYTSGITAVGASITKPATPTKTGYTFAAWTPAVAATMPAANTTYTATWTANTNTAYTVKHYQQNIADDEYTLFETENLKGTTDASVTPAVKTYTGFTAPATQTVTILPDGKRVVEYRYTRNKYTLTWNLGGGTVTTAGTAAAKDATGAPSAEVKYGATITVPEVARDGYHFDGWDATPAATMPAEAKTYTAGWTIYVASVKIGSTTTYHTTLADAFTKAKTGDNAVITMLQDVEGLTTQLQYNPTTAYKCTLDLNNHKVEGTIYSLLYINKSKSTFTITDNSAEKEGQISSVYTGTAVDNATRYGVYVNAGNLVLEEGTIYFENRRPRTDGTSLGAVAVGVSNAVGYTFTMNGGTIEAKGNYRAYGVYSNGTTKINGGTVKATVPAGTNHSIAYGVAALANTTTINDGATITVEAPTAAYGVASLSSTNSKTGAAYKSTLTVEGGTINVTTTGKNAYGAYTVPATRTITKTETGYTPGEYGVESTLNIHGGTFNVTAHTSGAYGVYAGLGAFYTKTTPNEVKTLYQSTVEITGGTFHIKTDETTGTTTAEGVRSYGSTIISGGTFDINANTNTAYGVHVYKGKTTINGNPSFTVRADATIYGASAGETPNDQTGMPYDGELEINGGTFDVATTSKASTNNNTVYGVRAYANKRKITSTQSGYYIGNYASAGTVTVNGGEFVVDGNNAIAGIICSGTVTQAAATISDIACPAASATAKMTVNGGKFKVTGTSSVFATNNAATTANFKLQGGWFNIKDNTSYLQKYVAPTNTASNYYVFDLAGQSPYKYEVAEGATITWDAAQNGGTTSATTTVVKKGSAISSQLATLPTAERTGYTFKGWYTEATGGTKITTATAVSANTTYCAQFEINKFTLNIAATPSGYGTVSVAKVENVPYGSAVTVNGNKLTVNGTTVTATPAATTAAYTYAFSEWLNVPATVTANVTNIQAVFTQTDNVASVTVGSTTTYYTTVQAALDYAGTQATATVKLLRDITGITTALNFQPTKAGSKVTLDLNNFSIEGTITDLLTMNASGKTLTITDNSTAKGGQIKAIVNQNATVNAVNVAAGHLVVNQGKIYAENTNTSSNKAFATAVQVGTQADNSNSDVTLNAGTLEAKAVKTTYGIYTFGQLYLNGGIVKATSTDGANNTFAYGLYVANNSTEINGGTIVSNGAYKAVGIYAAGLTPTADGDMSEGSVMLNNATMTVTATNNYAYGFWVASAKNTTTNDYNAGVIQIEDGDFTITSTSSKAIGVYVGVKNGSDDPTIWVYGGKYKLSGNETDFLGYQTATSTDALIINGGYYNVHVDVAETDKNYFPSPKHEVPTTAADKASVGSEYIYKVADAHNLTWVTDGDELTGTYTSGITEDGVAITKPNTPTKTGYTFKAWTPAVNATMPAANKTYTATWTANTNTHYTVEHYQQNLANDEYTKVAADTESKTGTTAAQTAAVAKTYPGFTAQTISQATIAADGSTVVKIYYNRNSYNLAWNANGGDISGTYTSGSVKFGASITAPANANVTRTGYTFTAWNETPAATMPASDKTYTAQWNTITYNISYTLNGGTVGTPANPTTYNVETATITLTNPTKEGYTFTGWTGSNGSTPQTAVSIANGSTGDKNYTANWAVNVASVTVNGATTYYTTIDAAFTAANASATYEPTITLLQDAVTTTTSMLSYTGAKNCTLNLNGHTLSSTTAQALLYINKEGITFTITDLTESKSGTLHLQSTGIANRWCVYVANGNLQMDAGTVFLRSQAKTYNEGVRIDATASTFTMNGGKVQVVTSNSKPACGIVSRGKAFINGGEIQVEASGIGYGIEARVSGTDIGNVTVNGGKFLVTGTTAACAYRSNANATLKLQGGYYNTNASLATYCATNYHVFDLPASEAPYKYEVAEGYTITFNANGHGTAPAAQLVKKGEKVNEPAAPTADGYTFGGWYKETGCTNAWIFSTATVTAAQTLYAKWTCVSPTALVVASTDNKWDFCAGETMTLTVSGLKIATNATYQWKLGGTNIAGATSATYTTTMSAAKAGAYTCTVTNGSCSETTSDYYVRVWQLYINNGASDAWQTLDFANTAANTGNNATVALTSDKNYKFKLKDNTGGWFGLNSKTVTRSESAFALNGTGADVNIMSGMAGNYTFTINYSDKNNPTVAITYPTANQPAGRNIYFDKSVITGWTSESANDLFLRIGKPTHNKNNTTDNTVWTLVPGTDRFYTIKTLAYDGFEAWQIANNTSWSDANSIYLVNGSGYEITKATNFQKYVVGTSGVTIVPTSSNNTEKGCNYWNVAVTDGMLTHKATITASVNGTVSLAYTDVNNAAQTKTTTTSGLAHRTKITAIALPAMGYKVSTFTVTPEGGSASSLKDVNGTANNHILATNATFAATFSPITYSVHFNANEGVGTMADESFTYDEAKALTSNSFTREGYTFLGWATSASGEVVYTNGQSVSNLSSIDGAIVNLYAKWGINSFTITFQNYDGTELQSGKVNFGETPAYSGATPQKPNDETYSYTFTGWLPAVASVTADATYTAQFDADERYYIAPTTQRQDIVDWDLAAGSVTLNMNGYSSNTSEPAGWTVTIGSATKNKDDRAADRTLSFTGLSLTAGEKLLITVHNSDGNVDSRLLYTIPTVYTTSATITVAPTRVLWVKSGTLTVNDNISVDSIYVCPGAELKINSGKTLTVGTLVMRTETTVNQYYNPPVLTDNGTLDVTNMYYTRIVRDRSQAFQLGFPFSVNLNNTKYSNGKTATFLKDYSIMYYDAQSRADNGLQGGEIRNWKALTSGTTTLQANQGYQLLSTSNYYTEYYFPVTYSKVTNGAQVSVTAYSGKASAGDQGWNYITLPYTHRYSTNPNLESPLLISELTEDNQTFWQHVVTDLLPVSPFYYQCSELGYLTFTEGNLQKQKPAQESARSLTQWLQLLYGKTEQTAPQVTAVLPDGTSMIFNQPTQNEYNPLDEMNIFLHPDKFTVDYETGFDMQKMSLESTRPLLYSPMACGNLAMVAVPDTMAEQSTIPVTVFAPQKQEMSFSLGSFDYTDRLSHVWLIDKELGTQTDLLFADYEYMAEQGTTAGRFYVRAEFRKIDIPTDIETDGTNDDKDKLEIEVKGLDINIGGLKQGEYVRLYDAVGKLITEQRAGQDGIVRITASTAGTYLLQTDKLFKKVSVVAL